MLTYVNSYGSWIKAFEDANPVMAATGNHFDCNAGDVTIGDTITEHTGREKLSTNDAKRKGKHKGWNPWGLLLHRNMAEIIVTGTES